MVKASERSIRDATYPSLDEGLGTSRLRFLMRFVCITQRLGMFDHDHRRKTFHIGTAQEN